jgi:glycerol-3-phosphate dehydrogenase
LSEEINYLLDYFNRYATGKASRTDVSATFVGQRPLLQVALEQALATDTKSLVRDHEVEVDGRSKLVSIMGGKWTTYRVMASDTLDVLEREVFHQVPKPCLTANYQLSGGDESMRPAFQQLVDQWKVAKDIQTHLWETYGSNAVNLLAEAPKRIHPDLPYLESEIDYLKTHEMASSWDDVLMRRWGIGLRNQEVSESIKGIKKEAFAS